MPNVIRTCSAPSDQWPLWVAGAVAGALTYWFVLRSRAAEAVASRGHSTTPAAARERWSAAGFRPRSRTAPPPDLTAITERLHGRPGTSDLHVRSLGGGILELVGSAPDELDLPDVLHALAAEAGVSVVVNRVWTSRSGAP